LPGCLISVIIDSVKKKPTVPEKRKRSLKELLLTMPDGEDADFERSPDYGRDVELEAASNGAGSTSQTS
jgi:hypothetical protein